VKGGPGAGPVEERPIVAVFLATFFVRFAFGSTLAVFAAYITLRTTGLATSDVGTAGIVSALAPVGEFSTVLLAGVAADRWGRFPVLFGGMAGAGAIFLAVASTRTPLYLGAANLVFGVASGAILASSLAVIADRSKPEVRGLEMGRFDAMNLAGWVTGYAFGLGVESVLPNRELSAVFLTGAGVLAAGLFAARALLQGSAEPRDRPVRPIAVVLRSAVRAKVLVVTLPWLAIYALIGVALVFLGPAASGIGIRTAYLAVAIAGGGGLLVITQPSFGRLADRWGRTRLMTIGALGFGLVMLFASLLTAYGLFWPYLVGIGAGILLALAYGPAALAALADLALELSRATTMAIYSLTISLGMVVGLLGAATLVPAWGNVGLYVFFGAIAAVLAVLTAVRWLEAARATIPVR
jgi:MFS family permease